MLQQPRTSAQWSHCRVRHIPEFYKGSVMHKSELTAGENDWMQLGLIILWVTYHSKQSGSCYYDVRRQEVPGVGCLCTSSGWLKHIEPPRTYTILTITELARCVGCLCTRSGWFKHSEPHRTYTILTITELARCVGCFCTRSGWFKHIEPHRTYTNHTITEIARCVGCFCTSSGGSSTSNLHEPHHHRYSKVCRVLMH